MSDAATRAYYDEFSRRYEDQRRPHDPGGYHALLDDLEIDFTARFGRQKDILEVGCGTGLVLERLARFAKRAEGIDLSPGMLEKARERGLDVREGSATDIPYPDASFDVVCSYKVLAHVPDLAKALSEMSRVTRPGGFVLAELYNPVSFRGLAKRFGPAGKIGDETRESAVYTRFDRPSAVVAALPDDLVFFDARGVRIVTPVAAAMRLPIIGGALKRAEHALADGPLRAFAGFYIVAAMKRG